MKSLLFLFLTSSAYCGDIDRLFGNRTFSEGIRTLFELKFTTVNPNNVNFLWYKNGLKRPIDVTNMPTILPQNTPLKIIIHGWSSKGTRSWVKKMVKSFHKIKCTTISVDWGKVAFSDYVTVAGRTKSIGVIIANFLKKLDTPPSQIHLIGHSLGAHISGFVGRNFGNLSRISALDPAGLLFTYPTYTGKNRLLKTDADFVDVIHCQIVTRGMLLPVGSVDFYPHAGMRQPDCMKTEENLANCNHKICHSYYTLSISSPKQYVGRRKCVNCDRNIAYMGYWVDQTTAKSSYYVDVDAMGLKP